jgi:hypothetical protein
MANAKEARIEMYLHCKTCIGIGVKKGKKVPVDYGEKLAVGWTREGIQVVCENCGKNVIDIDFGGIKVKHYNPGI